MSHYHISYSSLPKITAKSLGSLHREQNRFLMIWNYINQVQQNNYDMSQHPANWLNEVLPSTYATSGLCERAVFLSCGDPGSPFLTLGLSDTYYLL